MSEDLRVDDEAVPPDDAGSAEETEAAGQVAFDVEAFPGGARSAIEAVLMVVDEPVSEVALATALEVPLADVRAHLEAWKLSMPPRTAASPCGRSAAGGGSTAGPTTPRPSRSSSSTGSRPG